MERKKGFTLIGFLVVITIIALLLSIVMPSLRTAKIGQWRFFVKTTFGSSGLGCLPTAMTTTGRCRMRRTGF